MACVCAWIWAAIAPAGTPRIDRFFLRGDRVWNIGLARDHAWVWSITGWSGAVLRPGERVLLSPGNAGKQWGSLSLMWGYYGSGRADTADARLEIAGQYKIVGAQWWLLTVMTALLPAAWLARRLRETSRSRRVRRGLCPSCGYDLRATPDRCPECGAVRAGVAQ